jgi:hypothetical protein
MLSRVRVGPDRSRYRHRLNTRRAMSEFLTLTDEDDGKLFRVRVLNTGEVRIARYHCHRIGDIPLKFPCFADPDDPDDYRRWLH